MWSEYWTGYEGRLVGVYSTLEKALEAAATEARLIHQIEDMTGFRIIQDTITNINGESPYWYFEDEEIKIEIHEERLDNPRVIDEY